MKYFTQWLRELLTVQHEILNNVLLTIFCILTLWFIRFFIIRIVMNHTEDIRVRYIWQKSTKYVTFIIGLVFIVSIWSKGIQDLATYLAVVSAGIAIALRDILKNVAGWLFIIWIRPLAVGDRIEIGDHSGDVVDVSLFHFTLMEIGNWVNSDQSTGRIITIPNGAIFTEALANFGKGFQYIWNEIPVLITFESNWEQAKNILLDIAKKHGEKLSGKAEKRVREASKRYLIYYNILTPTVYTSVVDCGVLLTIRYLCEPRKRRGTEQTIWEYILKAFSETDDIDFAYPTQRFYNNSHEGKTGTKPEKPQTDS
ncbi:mechanosensitive ion channel family protein [Candidatus Omnitrophota bacterium]